MSKSVLLVCILLAVATDSIHLEPKETPLGHVLEHKQKKLSHNDHTKVSRHQIGRKHQSKEADKPDPTVVSTVTNSRTTQPENS